MRSWLRDGGGTQRAGICQNFHGGGGGGGARRSGDGWGNYLSWRGGEKAEGGMKNEGCRGNMILGDQTGVKKRPGER